MERDYPMRIATIRPRRVVRRFDEGFAIEFTGKAALSEVERRLAASAASGTAARLTPVAGTT